MLRNLLSYPIIRFLWQRSHTGISQFLRESWAKCSRVLIGHPPSSMVVTSWISEKDAANFSENKNSWYYPRIPSGLQDSGLWLFFLHFFFVVVIVLKISVTPSPPLPMHFCVFLLLKPSREICSPGSLGMYSSTGQWSTYQGYLLEGNFLSLS